ncbi:hypothetical protein [Falsiroseomonas oryziterrae]|uniref:hypothetical protein n=1 Tax=Falsiroseomonas oryziterrae TaxID=2911368 RepID=UPI001F45BFDD|nr:hypothetical protein [Roseomonas sp. NPKOSM-4]
MTAVLAILLGAALLAWPAVFNGYPLVFIDTVSYLNQTTLPELPWDKTLAYGPFLHLFHWQVTLWPAVAAQVLIASHLVWLAQRMARGRARPGAHLLACAALSALTSAPWFLAALMPDALTGVAALCVLLLGCGRLNPWEAAWVVLLGTLAVAVHLSHLPTAVAVVALVALLTRSPAAILRSATPVGLALLVLLGSNLVGFGRATLSPHGSVFLLARLQADGPAAEVIRARCPDAGWHLCAFADRLPMDSDEFLWDGTSPLNRNADGSPRPMGGVAGAAEARAIIAATLRDHPGEVAMAMLRNGVAQLRLVEVGDTLGDTHLDASARRAIAAGFPPRELEAFDAGLQMRGELPARAAPFLVPHLPMLILALALAPALLWRAWRRRDLGRGALVAGALLALLANAAATGALSKPHHRYEARIVWLLPLAVMLAAMPTPRRR